MQLKRVNIPEESSLVLRSPQQSNQVSVPLPGSAGLSGSLEAGHRVALRKDAPQRRDLLRQCQVPQHLRSHAVPAGQELPGVTTGLARQSCRGRQEILPARGKRDAGLQEELLCRRRTAT